MTHFLVLGLSAQAVSMTVASAHNAPPVRNRLELRQLLMDRPVRQAEAPFVAPAPAAVEVAAPVVVRPKPHPVAPLRVPPSKAAIAQIIRDAAARWGVDGDHMVRIAMCESGLNPNSVSYAGAEGLFQFKPSTFYAHGGHDIWDSVDQSNIASKMFSQGLAYMWTCR